MRRLDIGVSSYGAPQKLHRTIETIRQMSVTDWRVFIIDNPHPTQADQVARILANLGSDPRIQIVQNETNIGYAGAVNRLFELAETEYIAYFDNDVIIRTKGWDEAMCGLLDRFHEVGMVFPNGGDHPIPRGNYQEVMWAVGFAWVLNRVAMTDVGSFDQTIGHQEEADYALRLRMNGYRCAALPQIRVDHDATASSNPASTERINRGVINWMNKWLLYFCGKGINYHSPNVLRWEDWPPNALYLEEYWKRKPELEGLNDAPHEVRIDDRQYDLILTPKLAGFYRGRII